MTIINDTTFLNTKFAARLTRLHKYLIDAHETGRTKTRFEIFETFRTPMRQRDLIAKKVTKAGPLQSAHQFGLAADLVPYLSPEEAAALSASTGERVFPGWNWHSSHDYRFLATAAETFKLACAISWDPCHVQHPDFEQLRKTMRKYFE